MRLNKHCLRIDNDVDGFQQLRWMVKVYGHATLMYDTSTRHVRALRGYQYCGGALVFLGDFTSADLPKISVQLIYDQLADALEQRWERGWING